MAYRPAGWSNAMLPAPCAIINTPMLGQGDAVFKCYESGANSREITHLVFKEVLEV